MDIAVRDGYDNMDWDSVTALLREAYWCAGIGLGEVQKGAANSALNVGAFCGDKQIGYLRVVSDKTRYAYIMDVIVHPDHRGKGAGLAMMQHTMDHPALTSVRHWTLITRDAHGLYEKFGFAPTKRPADWLEIRKTDEPR